MPQRSRGSAPSLGKRFDSMREPLEDTANKKGQTLSGLFVCRVSSRLQAVAWRLGRNQFFHSWFSQTTRIGAALKIDEYVPDSTPMSRVTTKCRMVLPPNKVSASRVSMTVSWVLMDRSSVCTML